MDELRSATALPGIGQNLCHTSMREWGWVVTVLIPCVLSAVSSWYKFTTKCFFLHQSHIASSCTHFVWESEDQLSQLSPPVFSSKWRRVFNQSDVERAGMERSGRETTLLAANTDSHDLRCSPWQRCGRAYGDTIDDNKPVFRFYGLSWCLGKSMSQLPLDNHPPTALHTGLFCTHNLMRHFSLG